ncbi:hypothetical protein [Chondromyces crocatus]|uniref:Uncharacterized protein n=1 Tax=Chondromyces crocatus TaxID=52 RepID=A0A0K1EJB5_CHOCO|nr:hypothetical protein [Chondromyces crocatus]AKT40954.1 uncharacterized protein CMC5_051110 [Chondromyces crocatus]
MTSALRSALCVALAAALGGCVEGARFVASPQEYAAYRAHRTEPSLEARLSAASDYLKRYPEGAFAGEVKSWLQRAEPVYFEVKQGSAAGLRAYLGALPDGAFSARARVALAKLEIARAPDDVASGEETEARIDAQQALRERAVREVELWLDRLLDPRLWGGAPMSQAPASVLVPFSLALPWPACRSIEETGDGPSSGPNAPAGVRRCAKLLSLPYSVSGGVGGEERELTLEVAVVQDAAGRPIEATVGGPEMFTRLEEARSVRAIDAGDAAARVSGISLAVTMARRAFSAKVSEEPTCRREPVAPVVLALGCGGVALDVRAAIEAGDDDRILITPLSRPAQVSSAADSADPRR